MDTNSKKEFPGGYIHISPVGNYKELRSNPFNQDLPIMDALPDDIKSLVSRRLRKPTPKEYIMVGTPPRPVFLHCNNLTDNYGMGWIVIKKGAAIGPTETTIPKGHYNINSTPMMFYKWLTSHKKYKRIPRKLKKKINTGRYGK